MGVHTGAQSRGVTRVGKGAQFLGRQFTRGGAEWLQRAPKKTNNVTSSFFNRVHLLPKDLKSEQGGAKLASWSGRHLTSFRPWHRGMQTVVINVSNAVQRI